MAEKRSSQLSRALGWAAVGAALYVSISYAALALRQPELTQTQVLLRFVDAVLWR